jgi:hypothetical protein
MLFKLPFGSFHVEQAKIKQKCHPGLGISKLIFFMDSTSNSKKKSRITYNFERYDYFLLKKGSNLQNGLQKRQDKEFLTRFFSLIKIKFENSEFSMDCY